MGLVTKYVELQWSRYNKNRYIKKGYQFTKFGDSFTIKIEDLSITNRIFVDCICDNCGEKLNVAYGNYKKYVKDDGKYYCFTCSNELFVHPNIAKAKLKNSISFKQWCYENLSKEKADRIITSWDINKNDCLPDDISFCSDKNMWLNCPDCGCEKFVRIATFVRDGFGCNKCSDGVSFPEKFFYNVLEQLKIKFDTQYSKANAKWCDKYRYDFYLPDYNIICEIHGDVHYRGWSRNKGNLEFQIQNDKIKKELALSNGIEKYIIIDARYSTFEWIKDSIFDSELNAIFDLSIINWIQCEIYATSSLVKKACELWNNGIKNTNKIGNIIRLHPATIIRYLKRGAKIGLCDYDAEVSNRKKVVLLNTDEIFDSITSASDKYNVFNGSITNCCKGKYKWAGRHPVTDEPMRWMYYIDYEKMNESA